MTKVVIHASKREMFKNYHRDMYQSRCRHIYTGRIKEISDIYDCLFHYSQLHSILRLYRVLHLHHPYIPFPFTANAGISRPFSIHCRLIFRLLLQILQHHNKV